MSIRKNSIPQDADAERGLICALLMGVDPVDVDPALFFDKCRRSIVVAIRTLRHEDWIAPQSTRPEDVQSAARENLERVAYAVASSDGCRDTNGKVRQELWTCLKSGNGSMDVSSFLNRLAETCARRKAIKLHQSRLDAAYQGDIATALAGTEFASIVANRKTNANGDAPVLVRLSDIEPEEIEWLWPDRIPGGKLTLIAGDPGLGKSLLTTDLAARVSAGHDSPDGTKLDGAGGVVILSAEDDPADTIRPRLDAAGGDVRRIALLKAVATIDPKTGRKSERPVSLQTDLAAIESAIRQTEQCKLVIVDPINAYLGSVDSHRDAELRTVLTPLCELARRTGVAIVVVSHLNKSSGTPAIYRTQGSIGFVAAARVVWLITKDANQRDGRRRLMLPAKANLGPDSGGLAFEVESCHGGQPVLAWSPDLVTVTADDVLSVNVNKRESREAPALSEAVQWLKDTLASGPQPAKELMERATKDGIKENTLRRAKDQLKIEAKRHGFGADGAWMWQLPLHGIESAA